MRTHRAEEQFLCYTPTVFLWGRGRNLENVTNIDLRPRKSILGQVFDCLNRKVSLETDVTIDTVMVMLHGVIIVQQSAHDTLSYHDPASQVPVSLKRVFPQFAWDCYSLGAQRAGGELRSKCLIRVIPPDGLSLK